MPKQRKEKGCRMVSTSTNNQEVNKEQEFQVTPNEWEKESKEMKDEVTKDQKKKKQQIIKEVLLYLVILFLCVKIIPEYVLQHTIVDGPSMENTLQDRDHLMVEKITYHFDSLDRFDIIAFYPYGKEVDEYYIKRIIGLPGETIQIKGSDIYINGEILEENYGKDPITYAGIASEPITLGEGEYFVLGDNRSVSFDSRSEEVGIVRKNQIGGKAILRIWPLSEFGTLK